MSESGTCICHGEGSSTGSACGPACGGVVLSCGLCSVFGSCGSATTGPFATSSAIADTVDTAMGMDEACGFRCKVAIVVACGVICGVIVFRFQPRYRDRVYGELEVVEGGAVHVDSGVDNVEHFEISSPGPRSPIDDGVTALVDFDSVLVMHDTVIVDRAVSLGSLDSRSTLGKDDGESLWSLGQGRTVHEEGTQDSVRLSTGLSSPLSGVDLLTASNRGPLSMMGESGGIDPLGGRMRGYSDVSRVFASYW